MALNFSDDPHRRYNILTGEWMLVSPHRTKRPWQGKQEAIPTTDRPSYDPNCYLCPGNVRANGKQTPYYKDTYAFDNDFGALLPHTSDAIYEEGLLKARGEQGICRVLCFSPDHSLTLAEMELEAIRKVVDLWEKEYSDLGSKSFINHVQIFENRGKIMGSSNPHPHGQIWAQNTVPEEAGKKLKQQQQYWDKKQSSLLADYLKQEMEVGERLISQNDHFVTLVPFWAVWPYEAIIIPKRHFQHLGQTNEEEKDAFADIIKDLTQRYDKVFNVSFPYSSGLCQAPTDGAAHEAWHFHMAFYPPLLRSATVKKFMVGYEMFGNPQRDITAEMAAEKLRKLG
ncbi:MAG: UDP-glucose--hexose-1-phosphate uridylyltransferase [Bacteroidota bacterium]